MSRVYTLTRRSVYEPSGDELRIYWDERSEIFELEGQPPEAGYSYAEAVVSLEATAAEIEAAVVAVDSTADGAELAAGWFATGIPEQVPPRFRTLAIPVRFAQFARDCSGRLGYTGAWSEARGQDGAVSYIITTGWMPPEMVWSDPVILWRQLTDGGADVAVEDVVAMLEASDCSGDGPLVVERRLRVRISSS